MKPIKPYGRVSEATNLSIDLNHFTGIKHFRSHIFIWKIGINVNVFMSISGFGD